MVVDSFVEVRMRSKMDNAEIAGIKAKETSNKDYYETQDSSAFLSKYREY